ncbi:MAG: carboxypeptidase M32 [Planctomycetota bacterium]
MSSTATTFEQLVAHVRETALWSSIQGLLEWDERTLMPVQAGPYRVEQVTVLAGAIHQRNTDPRLGQWLGELSASPLAADPHRDQGATIRQLKRDYDKRVKLPLALVEALTRATMQGQQAWVSARQANNFAAFEPFLAEIVRLRREQAQALGYQQHPYDALLDDYEPGATTAEMSRVLGGLCQELAPLVRQLTASSHQPSAQLLARHFPQAAQEAFGRLAAERIGFDFERGRLDVTHHPFCAGMGPHDCRITTRYDEQFFPQAFFGILHEAGHGIYEQGLRPDWFGLPPGTAVSLGIHESQSRLWENLVGRSRPFWRYFFGEFQRAFPGSTQDLHEEQLFAAINVVQPSLIRVEADEATYNLHIMVRFELEQALIADQLAIGDLPGAWKEKYQQYLGITPPTDAQGVLQDIHWSAGLIGYFPTYSLGNLYASQLFEAADRELGGLAEQFQRGEFTPLRDWLQTRVHTAGQCYDAGALVQRITGEPLSHEPLMRHLCSKFLSVYGPA